MLTVVKNQMRVCALSVKYNIMREMVNKVTFLTNVGFMVRKSPIAEESVAEVSTLTSTFFGCTRKESSFPLMIRSDKEKARANKIWFFTVAGYACVLLALAVAVFYRGLRRYASGNLMVARL